MNGVEIVSDCDHLKKHIKNRIAIAIDCDRWNKIESPPEQKGLKLQSIVTIRKALETIGLQLRSIATFETSLKTRVNEWD